MNDFEKIQSVEQVDSNNNSEDFNKIIKENESDEAMLRGTSRHGNLETGSINSDAKILNPSGVKQRVIESNSEAGSRLIMHSRDAEANIAAIKAETIATEEENEELAEAKRGLEKAKQEAELGKNFDEQNSALDLAHQNSTDNIKAEREASEKETFYQAFAAIKEEEPTVSSNMT